MDAIELNLSDQFSICRFTKLKLVPNLASKLALPVLGSKKIITGGLVFSQKIAHG